MCHALRVRTSPVMAARVRLKIRRGIGVSPIVVLLAVCAVSSLVSGMFEHRHCDHQHPRAHEVSSSMSIAKGDSNLSSLYTSTLIIAAVFFFLRANMYVNVFHECDISRSFLVCQILINILTFVIVCFFFLLSFLNEFLILSKGMFTERDEVSCYHLR